MRILCDNGTPRGVGAALKDHVVEEARARGWDTMRNGDLLDTAEAAGFDVFVTTDLNLGYQQNLADRRIAIVVFRQAELAAHHTEACFHSPDGERGIARELYGSRYSRLKVIAGCRVGRVSTLGATEAGQQGARRPLQADTTDAGVGLAAADEANRRW